jgi:hypothetical protein
MLFGSLVVGIECSVVDDRPRSAEMWLLTVAGGPGDAQRLVMEVAARCGVLQIASEDSGRF